MAKADATQTKFTVELAQIRHSPTDGTAEVRVFLKNLGVDHLHLNQVSMDGVLLSEAQLARDDTTPPSEGEAKIAVVPRAFAPFYAAAPKTKIAWAWLSSSPVPPGGVAEFRVKLLSAPARRIPMTFTSQDGVAATASVAGSDDAAYVRITMAAFSADLKKCGSFSSLLDLSAGFLAKF